MRILYTKHARKKFRFLEELGWSLKYQDIKEGLERPLKIQKGYSGTKVAFKSLDKTHNLRIVYNEEGDIITVITFYPVEKGRYD